MNDSEWINGLKAGDKVIVNSLFNERNIGTVIKITNTQIVVTTCKNLIGKDIESRYGKNSGHLATSDPWACEFISEATEKALENIEYRKLVCNARKLAESLYMPKSIEGVKQLIEELVKYQKPI